MNNQGKRILVVEDSREYRDLLVMLISKQGYEFDSAQDGIEALEKLRAGAFDLIISDVLMPRMDGFQLCRAVKKDEKLKAIPIIFYTGQYTYAEDEELAQLLGAALYLHKPMQNDKLLENIRQVLERSGAGEISAPARILDEKDFTAAHADRLAIKLTQKIEELERERSNLQESEQRYRVLFEGSTQGILATDIETKRFVFANPSICRMLGYQEAELLQLGIADIHPRVVLDTVITEVESARKDQNIATSSVPCLRKDGAVFYADIAGSKTLIGGRMCAVGFFSDVTERKQIDDALKLSEANYRQLFDSSPVAIYQIDYRTGKFSKANDVMCKYLGCSREEITAFSPYDILTDESKQLFSERLKKIGLGEKVAANPEFEIVDKKGKRIVVQLNINNIYNAEGLLIGADVVAHDVTERKQAEIQRAAAVDALQVSELQHRTIFENSPLGMTHINSAGVVVNCNEAFAKIAGAPREKIIGFNVISQVNDPELKEAIQKSIDGQRVEYENIYTSVTGGKTAAWHVIINPVNPGQSPTDVITTHEDVTERKRMQDELLSAHLDLEKKVADRTLELAKINEQLTMEIMERMKSAAIIQGSEEKYRNILENIEEAYLEIDLKGNLIFFNDPACFISGYPRSELLGMNFRQYTSPETTKQLKALFGSIYLTGEKSSISDFDMVTKDKSTRSLELSSKLLKNPAGEAIGFRCIARDITERKQAEQALRKSDAQYRLLSEHMTDAVWLMDMKLNITYHSPTLEMLRGFTEQEIIGMPWEQNVAPESLKLAFEVFAEEIPKIEADSGYNPVRTLELEYYRKDGSTLLTESKFSIIRDESGKPVSILGEARDITERKRAEEVLRKSEARFKHLLQDVQAVAVQGYAPDGTTQYWNHASEIFYGYTAEEAIGRNLLDLLIPPEMRGDVEQAIRQMAETGQPIPASELSLMRKDGSRRAVYSSHTIIQIPGQTQELFCIDIDMTDRKQAEQDRVAREVAEKANHAKSIFVANMSHEIRTPMNAVMGFAQVLERDPTLTPEQAEHVRTIHRSGGHLLRLINDILDMSKIEAGRTTLNEAVFCLHDLLDDLLLMFRARAESQGLQLLMERDESVPRNVTADEGKLRQVLVNLLGNAVKFTAMGGVAVRVRAEAVEGKTGEKKESLRLVVEVEDTGPGIPDEDIGRIFDLFQQAGAGVESGGTGLGLAISRRFVEMMGGELTVTSQVGTGSCFRFDLLLKPAAEVTRRDKRASRRIIGLEPCTGPVRILAVDDAPTNRALLCALLRPLGFEVAEAGNGVEAIDIFAKWSPHAVLMDMRMPVMDGYEATRRLKATEAGSKTPVIAITASAFEDSRQEVIATGVDAYVRKPFRMEEICEVLGKYLGLRYVFADGKDKIMGDPALACLSPEARLALPQEIIQAMQQALEKGDSARLRELITQVEKLDSATARGLQALLERYDYEKLGQWLATS